MRSQKSKYGIRKLSKRRLPENLKVCFALFATVFFIMASYAQTETTIIGQVFDKYDKTPIPSVNVYFKNTRIGTATNDEGYFLVRSYEQEKIVVFSCIGYKTKEIKVRTGELSYFDIELEEENTWLMDVFVLPGVNPAMEWMKKIRLMRKVNDLTTHPGYNAESTEQDLILLSKITEHGTNKRLFEQMQKGTLSTNDSSLLIPLYMAESNYKITQRAKEQTGKNTFTSPEVADKIVLQLLNGFDGNWNFYENSVSLFGKSVISPLATIGNNYYNYYLTDSIGNGEEKQYEISFKSKNLKNLAFNGTFRFDSVSLALTYMDAKLPRQANINFIKELHVEQNFEPLEHNIWGLQNENIALNMTYEALGDSLNPRPELLIKRSNNLNISDSIALQENFAQSEYSTMTLEEKLGQLDNTPLMKTAQWIADAALTGYARAGVVDIGPLQQIIRLTDIEGIRLNVPVRTNERLWKNISIGGYAGYGFRNKEIKYSAFGQFRLPTEKRRVFEIKYTDDYRRIDYDYNNYTVRESPWNLGDEDMISTIFSFQSGPKISPRTEWSLSYSNDWNKNIESITTLRSNKLFANYALPLVKNGNDVNSIQQRSLTSVTRFSFDQGRYEDHLRRIYVQSRKPVIYSIFELGQYEFNGNKDFYGKIRGSVKQNVRLNIGQWNYLVDAGMTLGKVPYPLLDMPPGNEPGGTAFAQFNRIRYVEYATDKFINVYNEFIFNGIFFNYIPLIKHLNLREMVAVKTSFSKLSDKHHEVLDFPDPAIFPHYVRKMQGPYIEGSIGITNLLRFFTVQFNWRFTNTYEGVVPWSINAGLRIGF